MQDLSSLSVLATCCSVNASGFFSYNCHSCRAVVSNIFLLIFFAENNFLKYLEYILEKPSPKSLDVPLFMKAGTIFPFFHHDIIYPAGISQ